MRGFYIWSAPRACSKKQGARITGERRTARLESLLVVAGVLFVSLGCATDAYAADAVATKAAKFRLGNYEVIALYDTTDQLPNDGKVFGLDVGPAEVSRVLGNAGAASQSIALSVDALLVRGAGRLMLFDTGVGQAGRGGLLASLAETHTSPGEITDIFITHSHGDHTGGLANAESKLAFPNAVIHMSTKEWDWLRMQPANQSLIDTIASQVRTFEPGIQLVPGVKAIALHGHTPGHVGYEISSRAERLIDIGDLAHSAIVSLARPSWKLGFDVDRVQAAKTRQTMLARLATTGERVFAPHFPFPGVGRISRNGEGYVWIPAAQ